MKTLFPSCFVLSFGLKNLKILSIFSQDFSFSLFHGYFGILLAKGNSEMNSVMHVHQRTQEHHKTTYQFSDLNNFQL